MLVPIVLEATGHPFFSRVFRFFENSGVDAPLKYFALRHWQVEEGHEMLQEKQVALLQKLPVSDAMRTECLQMVERMFEAMAVMVDDLHLRMRASNGERAALRVPPPQPHAALD
ncbi:MAG: hypothetical protein ABI895_18105 [Deltaproteobacteria bacterium]